MDPVVIDKNKDLLPAQDYAFLREKGMEYIRELSGQIWTDHNLHDPGVTTLEVLCYALTDLGYRTGFDLQDLLTRPDGQFDPTGTSGLFPAHEVLPTAPLTIHDYRRLLLKIEGVRNAWLDPMMDSSGQGKGKQSEIPVFADCQSGELSFEPTNALGQKNQPLQINGLYKVLLELEIDDQLGSLNETLLVYQVPRGPIKGVIISIDSTDPAFISGKIDFGSEFQGVDSVLSVTPNGPHFDAQVRVNTTSGAILLNQLTIRVINARLNFMEEDIQVLPADIEAILEDNLAGNLIALFWKKQARRAQSIAAVCCVLDAHRNLSEDFLSIETVQAEGVSICADIELKADADIEEVQAQVHPVEVVAADPNHAGAQAFAGHGIGQLVLGGQHARPRIEKSLFRQLGDHFAFSLAPSDCHCVDQRTAAGCVNEFDQFIGRSLRLAFHW